MVTYQQAKEYFKFIQKVLDETHIHHNHCIIGEILVPDLVYLGDALSPHSFHLSDYNYSMMFSAQVVERIVNLATDEEYRASYLPLPLIYEIEENLPFWVRSKGVIAHALFDC